MTRQLTVPAMTVTVRLRRGGPLRRDGSLRRGGPLRREAARWEEHTLEVPGDFTVVELAEAIKGRLSPGLVYRHSCHHGSCGTCAMRVNGQERLACVTAVADVAGPGGRLTLEPLAHLPWIADLAVDPAPLMASLEALGPGHLRPSGRFADCIECGACVSACTIAGPATGYAGPAALTAARDAVACSREPGAGSAPGAAWPPGAAWAPGAGWAHLAAQAGGPHGVWQCHHTFECSRVCPAGVDPGGAIMALRWLLLTGKVPQEGVRSRG